jgi:dTDP-4-dehydrorhamnose reductase
MSDINVLVLGANGMLGKMVSLHLNSVKDINLSVTSRSKTEFIDKYFNEKVFNFDLTSKYKENLKKICSNNFDFVINCIGVIKPKIDEYDSNSVNETIKTNSYFPLELQNLCNELNIRYIQIGTDCVYSGDNGNYTEDSFKDPEDLYGKSKVVGEIEGLNKYLIRSSIIGPEK